MNDETTVLILAAGIAKRFWPLPNKLTLEFGDTTILKHLFDRVKQLRVKQIVVVTPPQLNFDLESPKLKTVSQTGIGQAAAILSAKDFISSGPVLVVNADDVVDADLFKTMLDRSDMDHNLIAGFKTSSYLPAGYLVLDGKKIAAVHEKPGEGNEPSDYVKLVCDYYVNGGKLVEYLTRVRPKNPDSHYEEVISVMMDRGEKFELFEYSGKYVPLKFPWQTLDVMEYFLNRISKSEIHKTADIDKSAKISGPVVIGKNVRILENAKINGPVFIGEGAIIGNQSLVRGSVVGANSVVGYSSEIARSWVGSDCWFHDNYIGDSVVSDHCAFGSGAVLANFRFDENMIKSKVRGVYTNTGKQKLGAMIGEGVRVGVGSLIMPGVKVGKNSLVGPGVVLNEDLEENRKCLLKQQLDISDNPVSNIHDRQKFRKQISKK